MLIDGVMIIAIIAIIIGIYVISVRGALNEYKEYCINGVLKTN